MPQVPLEIVKTLDTIHERVGTLVQKPLLHSAVPIDGRNFTIRREETNLGNMLADAVRALYGTDVGFFNSGAIRFDKILKATVPDCEPLRVRDVISMLTSHADKSLSDGVRHLSLWECPPCEEAPRRDYPPVAREFCIR